MGKGKVTKRERKFQATGGVKDRIKKGTITKKGKLRMRKKGPPGVGGPHDKKKHPRSAPGAATTSRTDGRSLDRTNDFLGEQNLAGLDMDSFFEQVSDRIATGADLGGREGSGSGSDGDNGDGNDEMDEAGSKGSKSDDSDSESGASGDASSDDGDSDSDDEDVAKAEARMKKQMASMERSDPTFHQFLRENEGSLLDFGEDKVDEDGDEGDDDNEEEDDQGSEGGSKADADGDEEPTTKSKPSRSSSHSDDNNLLTPKVLQALFRSAFDAKGVKGLKKLVAAYRSACHLADSNGGGGDTSNRARPGESGTHYRIESSKVFDELMVGCLGRCHEAFRYHLLGSSEAKDGDDDEGVDDKEESQTGNKTEENQPINPKTLENSSKWGDLKPILLSFFRSTLHVLLEAKEPELLTLILRALAKYVPLLSPFPHVASSTLKVLLQLWSAPLESSEDYQVVRLNSFVRIRQLALTQPFPFIEECMKRSYHSYASRAKFGASSSMAGLPTLTFMGNCIVELYSLDYHSAYQHAFVYIRQLAMLLRSAMHKKTTDGVYCWQYLHSLKLWTAVLSASAPEEDGTMLRSLVYPLTEVVLGTIRLSPSPRHLPLRLQCVRLLHQLAAATETFVPTAAIVLDCLDYKEWHLAPKKSQSAPRALQMDASLRLPSTDKQPCLRTREQLEPAMVEIMALLSHEVELYRHSPGFPEYGVGIEQRLRKFVKETREMRWKAHARGIMDAVSRYSNAAIQARSRLSEAPRAVRELECLRPMEQPKMRERLQTLLDRERKASAAAAAGVAPSTTKKGSSPSNKRGHNARDDPADDKEGDETSPGKKRKQKRGSKAPDTSERASKKGHGGGGGGGKEERGNVDQEDEVREGIDWSDDDED
jgi:nucleolar complex protein 2